MNEMNANAVETKEPENATAATPPKIIAVDFDGCLAVNKWPEVGEPIWKNINRLKEEQANGTKVILWTNRVGEPLEKAVSFCKEHDIHLDAVNENLPEIIEAFGGDCRKVFANEYWDDRAVLMDEEENRWASQEVEMACQREKEASEDTDDWAYLKGLQNNNCGDWSQEARDWCISVGLFAGNGTAVDGKPNMMWPSGLTREQAAQLFYRLAKMVGLA